MSSHRGPRQMQYTPKKVSRKRVDGNDHSNTEQGGAEARAPHPPRVLDTPHKTPAPKVEPEYEPESELPQANLHLYEPQWPQGPQRDPGPEGLIHSAAGLARPDKAVATAEKLVRPLSHRLTVGRMPTIQIFKAQPKQVGAADFLRSRRLPWQSAQGSDDDDGAPLELPRRLPERKTVEIHGTAGRETTNESKIRTSVDDLPRGQLSRADLLGWWAANGQRVMMPAATGSPSAREPHHLGRREPSSRGSCGL